MKKEKKPPSRTCVVCRAARDKRDLLRVVRLPDGGVVFDETGKLAGRGAYVCRGRECIDAGFAKGRLAGSLGASIGPETARMLANEMAAQCEPAEPIAGDR